MNPPDLRLTDTNSGTDSSGVVWGIQGALFHVFLVAAVLSLLLLLVLFSGLGVPLPTAAFVAGLPLVLAVAFIIFRQTHPPGHDVDLLDQLLNGRGFAPRPPADSHDESF